MNLTGSPSHLQLHDNLHDNEEPWLDAHTN